MSGDRRKKMDSIIHRMMINEISECDYNDNVFQNSQEDFKMFMTNITEDHVHEFSLIQMMWGKNPNMKVKVTCAIAYVNLISDLRKTRYMTKFPKNEIDISDLEESRKYSLNHVYNVIKVKTDIKKESLINNFIAELELSLEFETFNMKFLKRDAQKVSYYQRGMNMLRNKDPELANKFHEQILIAFNENKVVKEYIEMKQEDPIIEMPTLFMIDYVFSLAMLFVRSAIPYRDAMAFIQKIALFSLCHDVSREAQIYFWRQYRDTALYKIRNYMHEIKLEIFDDPYKINFSRLFNCVSCLIPCTSESGVLMMPDRIRKLNLIADICAYQINEQADMINENTTSLCEHLVHQILVQGNEEYMAYNKNLIRMFVTDNVKFIGYDEKDLKASSFIEPKPLAKCEVIRSIIKKIKDKVKVMEEADIKIKTEEESMSQYLIIAKGEMLEISGDLWDMVPNTQKELIKKTEESNEATLKIKYYYSSLKKAVKSNRTAEFLDKMKEEVVQKAEIYI